MIKHVYCARVLLMHCLLGCSCVLLEEGIAPVAAVSAGVGLTLRRSYNFYKTNKSSLTVRMLSAKQNATSTEITFRPTYVGDYNRCTYDVRIPYT